MSTYNSQNQYSVFTICIDACLTRGPHWIHECASQWFCGMFIQILTNAAPIDANIGWKPVLHHKILLLLKIIYYTYVLTAWPFSRLLNLGYQKLKRYFKTHLSTNLPILDEILVGNLLRIMKHPYLKGWCCICCFPCIRGAASS